MCVCVCVCVYTHESHSTIKVNFFRSRQQEALFVFSSISSKSTLVLYFMSQKTANSY